MPYFSGVSGLRQADDSDREAGICLLGDGGRIDDLAGE